MALRSHRRATAAVLAVAAAVLGTTTTDVAAAPARSGRTRPGTARADCAWTVRLLPTLPGSSTAIVNGADGTGTYYGMAKDAGGHGHLVSWRAGELTDVDSTADWAAAFGNRHATVAGTIGAADGSHHGALWTGHAAVRLYEPPGTVISEVTAVDDGGNLLGDITGPDWLTHAAMWAAGDPSTIHMLAAPTGTASGAMSADSGQISGFAGASGYVWDTSGALLRRIVPAGRGDIVQLKATAGHVSYGTEWIQADGKFRAITVDADGVLTPLPNGDGTAALAANPGGDIAGRDTQHGPAVIWTGGARIDLPSLDGLPNGFPMALDPDRTVVGALYDTEYRQPHPALWRCG